MSYSSENKLGAGARLASVREVIELLGFAKSRDGLSIPTRVASYQWFEHQDYRSWSGIELDLYKSRAGRLKATTRSTIGRSYWDLVHQNKTIKLLHELFGGSFETDAGRNRCWRPISPPPSAFASGCYLARWRFANALKIARAHLGQRTALASHPQSSGVYVIDSVRPGLLLNNMALPYLIAIWEEFFRETFSVALTYSKKREAALRRARLNHSALEKIALGHSPVERAVAESFSFQRPTSISENFRVLDDRLDIGGTMRVPYRRRRQSLFESIEEAVERRNEFVHTGTLDHSVLDAFINKTMDDLEVAVKRVYARMGAHYGFTPIRGIF